jgi:hypothetical protein
MGRRLATGLVLVLCLGWFAAARAVGEEPPTAVPSGSEPAGFPWAKRVATARRYARHRRAAVSFAVIDERGRLRGQRAGRRFDAASVVKVMLMVAYLRQPQVHHRRLRRADVRLLRPMIKRSRNRPATVIRNRVGNGALSRLAHRVGMSRFRTAPSWGNSQITARDQARFMYRLERYVPKRHREFALGLLARIVRRQSWGIPRAVPKGWKTHFKGGWLGNRARGWRINQVATMRRPGRRLALAVLSRGNPTAAYGHRTIAGVTRRLLHGYNAY